VIKRKIHKGQKPLGGSYVSGSFIKVDALGRKGLVTLVNHKMLINGYGFIKVIYLKFIVRDRLRFAIVK
jgi:hypothetical protein